jgi:cytochrome b
VLGLFSAAGDWLSIEGPLAHTVSDATVGTATRLHRLGFDVILCLVAVHVAVNVLHDLFLRSGLIRGMITGSKPSAQYVDAAENPAGSTRVATICLVIASLLVFAIVMF